MSLNEASALPEGNPFRFIWYSIVVGFFFCLWFGGLFVDEQRVIQTIEDNSGIEDIEITEEWRLFSTVGGCGYADAAGFEITANRDGKKIKALMCTGWWFKGATLRYQW